MSFVINKAPKKSPFQTQQSNFQTPGPGKYNLQQKHVIQIPAPFNSSVPKISSFDMQYQSEKPLFYNQVDIKKIYQTKKKFQQTSVFASKVQRFHTQPSLSSTHYYSSTNTNFGITTKNKQKQKSSNAITKIRQQNRAKKSQSIHNKKSFVRVILSNPKNTQNKQFYFIDPSIERKTSGPGSYQIGKRKDKFKNILDWGLSKQKRFKSSSTLAPGPGCYQTSSQQKKKRQRLSSSFAYSGLKSHLDAIIYQTNIPLKKQLLEGSGMKSLDPGPGQYQVQQISKSNFHYGTQTFGSKQKRFNSTDQKQFMNNRQLGPGSYQINTNIGKLNQYKLQNNIRKQIAKMNKDKNDMINLKLKDKKQNAQRDNSLLVSTNFQKFQQIIIKNKRKKNKSVQNKSKKNNLNFCNSLNSKYGNWGQQQRFKINKNQKKAPGPGQYQSFQTGEKTNLSYVFNSKSKRNESSKQNFETPFYNINQNDISSRMQKIKIHLDNLKKVAIQKVPFATGAQRFKCIQKQQDNEEQRYNIENDRKIIYSNYKNQITSTVFKSTSQRMLSSNNNSRLGPGQYNIQGNFLQKKSFNRNYKYQVSVIIKPAFQRSNHSALQNY